MRHEARDGGGKFALLLLLCCHIGLLFVKRQDTILLRHPILKYPDSPVHSLTDSLRIYLFPHWRADLKIPGFAVELARMCLDGSRFRKEKVTDSKKYPDTCGRCLDS